MVAYPSWKGFHSVGVGFSRPQALQSNPAEAVGDQRGGDAQQRVRGPLRPYRDYPHDRRQRRGHAPARILGQCFLVIARCIS